MESQLVAPRGGWFTRFPVVRWGLSILILLGIAAGFGILTPQSRFAALQAQDLKQAIAYKSADSALTVRIDSLVHVQAAGNVILKGMGIKTCLDASPREIVLMQLPCDSLVESARLLARLR